MSKPGTGGPRYDWVTCPRLRPELSQGRDGGAESSSVPARSCPSGTWPLVLQPCPWWTSPRLLNLDLNSFPGFPVLTAQKHPNGWAASENTTFPIYPTFKWELGESSGPVVLVMCVCRTAAPSKGQFKHVAQACQSIENTIWLAVHK